MDFEWDERKAAANRRKHDVDFADAALALEDELVLTMRDLSSDQEDRFVSIGQDPGGQPLLVVYTWREDRIRLISARKATSKERRHYEGKP